jgi:UDP:flavonoid glycosyltransferase YjiC (YdhE family)
MTRRPTIGILALAEHGHLNATIQLGRELAHAGHAVRYLGDPSERAWFDDRGVPFAPLARVDTEFGPTYAWASNTDEVVLIDSILIRPTIDASNAGKRVINLSTTYPLGYDAALPPITCGLAPAHDRAARAQVRAAWEAAWRDHVRIQDPHPHVGRPGTTLGLLAGFARDRGWPENRWDARAAINPVARVPELVLAPAQLEFPRPATATRRYGGPCVYLDRPEPAAPALDARPLVYCAFGSQGHLYAMSHILDVLVGAARALPGVQLVVATGGVEVPATARAPNLVCVAHAPQIALLRRASLMLSHGGLNSLKEALCCGVPVIVLPQLADQPGNAARIGFHRLGAVAAWHGMTAARLAQLIRDALTDAALTRRVGELGEALRAEHARPTAARALSELL